MRRLFFLALSAPMTFLTGCEDLGGRSASQVDKPECTPVLKTSVQRMEQFTDCPQGYERLSPTERKRIELAEAQERDRLEANKATEQAAFDAKEQARLQKERDIEAMSVGANEEANLALRTYMGDDYTATWTKVNRYQGNRVICGNYKSQKRNGKFLINEGAFYIEGDPTEVELVERTRTSGMKERRYGVVHISKYMKLCDLSTVY